MKGLCGSGRRVRTSAQPATAGTRGPTTYCGTQTSKAAPSTSSPDFPTVSYPRVCTHLSGLHGKPGSCLTQQKRLNTKEIYALTVSDARSRSRGDFRAPLPLKALRNRPPFCLFSSWGPRHPLAWRRATLTAAGVLTAPCPLSVSPLL